MIIVLEVFGFNLSTINCFCEGEVISPRDLRRLSDTSCRRYYSDHSSMACSEAFLNQHCFGRTIISTQWPLVVTSDFPNTDSFFGPPFDLTMFYVLINCSSEKKLADYLDMSVKTRKAKTTSSSSFTKAYTETTLNETTTGIETTPETTRPTNTNSEKISDEPAFTTNPVILERNLRSTKAAQYKCRL